jgi:predicted phage terminase large subunit-like protein
VLYSFGDKRLYVLDIWRGKILYPQLPRKVISLANNYKPGSLDVEDAGLGPALIVEFRAASVPCFRGVKPSQSKPDRIAAMSSAFEARHVSLPRQAPWLGAFGSVNARTNRCEAITLNFLSLPNFKLSP